MPILGIVRRLLIATAVLALPLAAMGAPPPAASVAAPAAARGSGGTGGTVQKTSEPPESMADFFSETFPLEATLKGIDAQLARQPQQPELWQNRAALLASHGKHAEALESLSRALALMPPAPATPPRKQGGGPIIIVQRGPSHAGLLKDIAEVYLALGRREEARQTLLRAIDPSNPHMMACTLLGNLYLDEGNSQEALKYYDLMGHNLSTSGKISKGNALYNLKRYPEALAEYEVARHWKPELPSVLMHIGDAYLRVGRPGDAIAAFQKFLRVAEKQKLAERNILPVRHRLAKIAEKLKLDPATLAAQPATARNLGPSADLEWTTEPIASGSFRYGSEGRAFVFKERLWFVMGKPLAGSGPKPIGVWSSPDGHTWERVAEDPGLPSLFGAAVAVFANRIWIISGGSGQALHDSIFSSADGVTWQRRPLPPGFTPRAGFGAAVLDGRMFVVGGRTAQGVTGEVWQTTDGEKWEQVMGGVPLPGRHSHSLAAHDGQLWVIGGFVGGQPAHDVWASRDGRGWMLVTETPPFGPQVGHTTCSIGNRLWLIPADEHQKHAWSTTDGVGWREERLPTGSGTRRRMAGGQVIAFGGGLVQFGGFQDPGGAANVLTFGRIGTTAEPHSAPDGSAADDAAGD